MGNSNGSVVSEIKNEQTIIELLFAILAASPLVSRGFVPRGDPKKIKEKFVKDQVNLQQILLKKLKNGFFCFLGGEGLGCPKPQENSLKSTQDQ